ncbi:MAG: 50S ribosomal protein L32 [Clostridia bacterium]|nr:50S ribosomal protein L32 [Clostridia bacterium]MBR1675895.1 50S ribosomal protein L32 [Clostridia bacterium]
MAVPKHKVSKQRSNTRFSNNYKVKAPTLIECPQCHGYTTPHRVCPKCGYYDGKLVVEKAEKTAE